MAAVTLSAPPHARVRSVVCYREPVVDVADPWITLAAMTTATERIRLGPTRPVRRAARHQGFFPIELDHAEQLAEIVADLAALRRAAGGDPTDPTDLTDPYDVVVALPPGSDPAPYVAAGASWWLVEFPWDAGNTPDQCFPTLTLGTHSCGLTFD
jgi:hypothetical protein